MWREVLFSVFIVAVGVLVICVGIPCLLLVELWRRRRKDWTREDA